MHIDKEHPYTIYCLRNQVLEIKKLN